MKHMWSKLMHIGLIVIVIALLLGNLAVCVEAVNDPQTKNPQKCQGSKPDECNGQCVNFQNDKKNCGSCGNACNPDQVCHNGKCVCPGSKPNECNDKCVNFKNDEKNCGSCGNACNPEEVCSNGKCVSGTSSKKATCTDGKKNGNETDVDCGGPICPACADGKTCKNGTDCSSGVCAVGFCQAPSCVDQVKNEGETGV